MPSLTIADIVREYFPDADDNEVEYLIWDETGYPCFWPVGSVYGDTPMECFRMQIAIAACRELYGEYGYFDNEKLVRVYQSLEKEKGSYLAGAG